MEIQTHTYNYEKCTIEESFKFFYKEILRKNDKYELSIFSYFEKIAQNFWVQMLKKRLDIGMQLQIVDL